VNRLAILVILAVILIGSTVFGVSDINVSLANTGIPNNEPTSSVGEANNSSASATIMITMYTLPDD
jgi:hypothetical protein